MNLARTAIGFVLVVTSACIHPSPEAGIRAAFAELPNARPSGADNGAQCSEPKVRVSEIRGNEAIASLFQDCVSATGVGARGVTRFSSDYLLAKHGSKWVIVKPLGGAVSVAG